MTRRSVTKMIEEAFAGDIAKAAVRDFEKEQWSKDWKAQLAREIVADDEVQFVTIENVDAGDRVLASDGNVSGGYWVKSIVWRNTLQPDGNYWIEYGRPKDTPSQNGMDVDGGLETRIGPAGTGAGTRVKAGTMLMIAKGN